jgi:hypothetical protein
MQHKLYLPSNKSDLENLLSGKVAVVTGAGSTPCQQAG